MTPIAVDFARALLHFIWQGALVALLLSAALRLLCRRSPQTRYLASCAALAALALAPLVTTAMLYEEGSRPTAARQAAASPARVATTLSPAPAPAPLLATIESWTLPVWCCGVLLFSLRLVWGCTRAASLRRRGGPTALPVIAMVRDLALRMDIARPIRVLESAAAAVPAVIGWLRPVLLLPPSALLNLTPEQLETILAHELAHIRRHDYLVNLLQMFVETALFYHPAVWWISARIRHERELCCDDTAVSLCGDPIRYARALARLEKLRLTPELAVSSSGGSLLYRIRRITGSPRREDPPSLWPGLLAVSLALAAAFAQAPQTLPETHTIAWDPPGVSVDTGGAAVLHRPRLNYGRNQVVEHEGTVVAEATIGPDGTVEDAHVLSGPEELRNRTLQNLLGWHFAPGEAGKKRQISFTFGTSNGVTDFNPTLILRGIEFQGLKSVTISDVLAKFEKEADFGMERIYRPDRLDRARDVLLQMLAANGHALATVEIELRRLPPSTLDIHFHVDEGPIVAANASHALHKISFVGLSDEARRELLAKLALRQGEWLTVELLQKVNATVAAFDPHLSVEAYQAGEGGFNIQIAAPKE